MLLMWGNSEAHLYCLLEIPAANKLQLPIVVTFSILFPLVVVFPSLSHFPTALQMLPGITLHSDRLEFESLPQNLLLEELKPR